jgi:cation:H+ antiporter
MAPRGINPVEIFVAIAAGLVALTFGGDFLVRGASDIAARFGLSPLLIGLTLVGFGTSTPELVTSIQAAFDGAPGIAVGNVVGSNVANILLILGLTALIRPFPVGAAAFRRDGAMLVISALMCLGVVMTGALSLTFGVVFVAALIAYLFFSVMQERSASNAQETAGEAAKTATGGFLKDGAFVVAGLVLVILGARWLVGGSITLAGILGVPDTVVGLTVVAVGTSLPELVTSIAAAFRGKGDLAFGNIIGSNIFNVLFILGATAIIKPIPVPPVIAAVDIWVMLAATAALVVVAVSSWRVTRLEGGLLLGGYIGYTAYLAATAL